MRLKNKKPKENQIWEICKVLLQINRNINTQVEKVNIFQLSNWSWKRNAASGSRRHGSRRWRCWLARALTSTGLLENPDKGRNHLKTTEKTAEGCEELQGSELSSLASFSLGHANSQNENGWVPCKALRRVTMEAKGWKAFGEDSRGFQYTGSFLIRTRVKH